MTFWDTANVYQQGASEEYVGRAVRRYARRQDVVLATKVSGRMHDGPTGGGCRGRRSTPSATRRCAGWAPTTSTCTSSTASTRRCRSRRPWPRCTSWWWPGRCATSARRRCGRGSSPRCRPPPWSTAGRRSPRCRTSTTCSNGRREREMLPMCADRRVGVVPYSPQGKGRLTRPWGQQTARRASRRRGRQGLRLPRRPADHRGDRDGRP